MTSSFMNHYMHGQLQLAVRQALGLFWDVMTTELHSNCNSSACNTSPVIITKENSTGLSQKCVSQLLHTLIEENV